MLSSSRSSTFRFLVRLHFWVLAFSFFSYLGFGFVLGPEFFWHDIRHHFFALADDSIVITAVVLPPPSTPVVTATPICVSGAARVALDWSDDSGATSFSLDRDSSPLTTGLVSSEYTDTSVLSQTSYTYVVTAFGPMSPGIASSLPVTVTTLDCPNLAPVTVTIETLGGKNVTIYRNDIQFTKRQPKVTGSSNVAYATIDITVSNPTIHAQVAANFNGYFEWAPPMKLGIGNHNLSVIATDPSDSSRTGSDNLSFLIKEEGSHESSQKIEEKLKPISTPQAVLPGFDFLVGIKGDSRRIYQKDTLTIILTTKQGVFPDDATASIVLSSGHGDASIIAQDVLIGGKSLVELPIFLPLSYEPGDYVIRADVLSEGMLVSRMTRFSLKGLPYLSFGDYEITFNEAVDFFGILFFSLLFLFLFLLLLFVREYWLYLHRLRHITERELSRFGFFGRRKGVIR